MTPGKILIVEDEMMIAADMAMQLTNLGFEVTGIVPRGDEVFFHVNQIVPDIILMDINLNGELDGIEIAELLQKKYRVAIIYLTSDSDEVHFERAKATNPYALIAKPFKPRDLQRAVEMAMRRINEENNSVEKIEEVTFAVLVGSIFIRNFEKMVKVPIADILYIEAERNYCKIHTKDRDHMLVLTLKELEQKISAAVFLRIHRSFIVNLMHIDEIAKSYVVIGKKAIPISPDAKKQLLYCMQHVGNITQTSPFYTFN